MATNKEIHEYLFKGVSLPDGVSVADQDKYLTLLAHKVLISERTGVKKYKGQTTQDYVAKAISNSWMRPTYLNDLYNSKGNAIDFSKEFVSVIKSKSGETPDTAGQILQDNLKKQLARAFLEQTKGPKQSKEDFNTYDGKDYEKNKSKNIVEVCYGSDDAMQTNFNDFYGRFKTMVADVKVLAASDITDADTKGFDKLYSAASNRVDSDKSVSAEQGDRSASVSSNDSGGNTDNESIYSEDSNFSDSSNENVDFLNKRFMSLSQKKLEGGRDSKVSFVTASGRDSISSIGSRDSFVTAKDGSEVRESFESVTDTDRDSTLSTDSTGSFHTAVGEAPNSNDGLSFYSAVGEAPNSGDNSPNTVYTLEGELHFDGNNRHGYSSPVSPERDSESKNSEAEPTGMSKLISNFKNVVKTFISSIANKVNTLLKSLGFNASKNEKDGPDLSRNFAANADVKPVDPSVMSSGSNAAKVAQDPSKSAAAAPDPENPRNGPGGP
jgi:hypothetical protein